VSLNKIWIDMQSFLKMVGGVLQIAVLQGFARSLIFFDGFSGNTQLADGYEIALLRAWGSGTRLNIRTDGMDEVDGTKGRTRSCI
jgi:hypothetical protein